MEQSLPEAVGVSTLELTQWLVREVVHCLHWATCADFSASRLSIVDSPRLDLCDVLFFLTHEKTLSQYALPFGTVRIPLITRESSLTCRSFKCCPMFCQCRSDARSHVSDLVKARLLRDHVHMPMGRRHGKCWMKNLGRLTLSLLNLFMRSLPQVIFLQLEWVSAAFRAYVRTKIISTIGNCKTWCMHIISGHMFLLNMAAM